MTRAFLIAVAVATLAGSALAAPAAFPSRIDLPDGFQPEGIAIAGEQFYAGSIPTGAVYSGSLRTGKGAVLVQPQAGRASIGLKVDRDFSSPVVRPGWASSTTRGPDRTSRATSSR